MALITCSECGKEYSENAASCPNCGNPNPSTKNVNVVVEKYNGFWSAGRLAIGVISIVLFVFIMIINISLTGILKKGDKNHE